MLRYVLHTCIGDIREFALQPFEPSDGCLALRKLMATTKRGTSSKIVVASVYKRLPFPIIDTKPFPTLPLCSPPVLSQFSLAIGPLGVSHLPADADANPRGPHSALLLHGMPQVCTYAFALVPPPHARVTLDLPLTLCQTPIFDVVGTLAPSTLQPRPRTPRTVPVPRLRWTVTPVRARIRTASTYWTWLVLDP
ncbi:hypothetical protein B0H13DRAFT_2367126 [Mycena leptocephala]|nr:hypothetical protein B0H13DRAFT_2367126 [Mycena leptocephala]